MIEKSNQILIKDFIKIIYEGLNIDFFEDFINIFHFNMLLLN